MDLESRAKWVEYSKAKDTMFAATDIPEAPWYVVEADVKKRARLNVMHHLLSLVPYEDLTPQPLAHPARRTGRGPGLWAVGREPTARPGVSGLARQQRVKGRPPVRAS